MLVLLGAVRFGCGGQADPRRVASVRLVSNERGVRLTMLRPQAEGGSGGGGAAGVGDAATDYALMT